MFVFVFSRLPVRLDAVWCAVDAGRKKAMKMSLVRPDAFFYDPLWPLMNGRYRPHSHRSSPPLDPIHMYKFVDYLLTARSVPLSRI